MCASMGVNHSVYRIQIVNEWSSTAFYLMLTVVLPNHCMTQTLGKIAKPNHCMLASTDADVCMVQEIF